MEPHILILAAGQGKRMRSHRPKVLHEVLHRPMLHYVLDLAKAIPHKSISVVVGHGEAAVRDACQEYTDVNFVVQKEQKGTADAVRSAKARFEDKKGTLIVLSGDVILLTKNTMDRLLQLHASTRSIATMLTAVVDDPKGYGRVLRRREDGGIEGIREQVDCSEKEREIREVNCGIYAFDIPALVGALARIKDHNKQGEFYLTDVIEILAKETNGVHGCVLEDSSEMTGINDRVALARAAEIMQARINREWMLKGVTLELPATTIIDHKSRLAEDVIVESHCVLIDSVVESGAVIEAGCRLVHSRVAKGSRILQGSYLEGAEVGPECSVGPYARLRPETKLGKNVKIGNFVEMKKSRMGEGSKASHLSYIGDAEIGADVNLGCGFITCNYDGKNKHKTIIEEGVFVGSDSQTVAPVKIGAGSYVASGTTITEDVPADSLVLSRGPQVVKKGYAKKYR